MATNKKLAPGVEKLAKATAAAGEGKYRTDARFTVDLSLRRVGPAPAQGGEGGASLAAGDGGAGDGAADGAPKPPAGMLAADFRLLSAVVIEDRAIDFSDASMLEAAVDKWMPAADRWGVKRPLVVYKDHCIGVDNWAGFVSRSWFAPASGEGDGATPAGVDGTLLFDLQSEPKLCRGLELGTVRSTSAGLRFLWRPSHDMELDEFWWRLGETVDGELVRMVVVEITEVLEQSVVWEGADEWAKGGPAATAQHGKEAGGTGGKEAGDGTDDAPGTKPDADPGMDRIVAFALAGFPVDVALILARNRALDPKSFAEPAVVALGVVKGHDAKKAAEDLAWSGSEAKKELQRWSSSDGSGDKAKIEWAKYALGFAWFDDADKENLGGYKLVHHTAEGNDLLTVWRGVTGAMGALAGSRGGVNLPTADRPGVYAHLALHYKQFGKDAPAEKDVLASARVADALLEVASRLGLTVPESGTFMPDLTEEQLVSGQVLPDTAGAVARLADLALQSRDAAVAAALERAAAGSGVDLAASSTTDLKAAALAEAFGKARADLAESKLLADRRHREITSLQEAAAGRDTELAQARSEIESARREVAELAPRAAVGTKAMADARAEVDRLYRLVNAGRAVPAVMAEVLARSGMDELRQFATDLQAQADQAYPLRCEKCGGTLVSRSSAHGVAVPAPAGGGSPSNGAGLVMPEEGRPSRGLHDA